MINYKGLFSTKVDQKIQYFKFIIIEIIRMLNITSSILGQMNALTKTSLFNFATRQRKIPNLHQRIKRYSKLPHKYQLKTIIRPPNLRDDSLEFPLRIPIRYRHLYKPTKPLFLDNTKDIKWQRLSPNEILLAFENLKVLEHKQIITGLQYLSKIQGQEKHDWNQHPWINQAFAHINKHFKSIKTVDLMKFYHLMKKLGCKHEEFWKQMYAKIEQEIYEIYPSDFEFIFLTYYKKANEFFSDEMKQKLLKLMEGRLRQFKNSSILQIFQIFQEESRLDTYWLENVFVPLFKHPARKYTIQQVAQIFRFMMIVGHEKNQRLYDNLYSRLKTYEYKTVEQVELLEEVILQVKQIFTSHRVEPYLEFLRQEKARLAEIKQQKKLELYEIVRQDMIFFMEKRKLKQQAQTV